MYELRRATPFDACAITDMETAIWKNTFKDSSVTKANLPNRLKLWSQFFKQESDSYGAYVLLDCNIVVGVGSFRVTSDQVQLLALRVLRDYQNGGLERLYFKIQDDATKMKKTFLIQTHINNL